MIRPNEMPARTDGVPAGPPLRVALDVRPWAMSGMGTYLQELLGAAARLDLPIEWSLIGPPGLRERMPEGLRIERWIPLERPLYSLAASVLYPSPGSPDVLHYPHYNLPLAVRGRVVVTVHDLFHLRYGNRLKSLYQRWFLRRLRWSRTHLITLCDKTANELTALAGIPSRRITRIAHGPGRRLPATIPTDQERPSTLTGRALRPPWLLAIGIDQPHKNFDSMLSALSLYFQRRPDAPPLVWTGPSVEACRRRARTMPASIRERVALEPYAPPDRLEYLYAGAATLLFPSLDEGFGLPPLEAMARGVPVVCARREPMTAILGQAPLYFEPTESASLWRMIDRLLDVPGIRQEVVGRGRRQAARYDWDCCARQTCATYGRIAGRDVPPASSGDVSEA